jgi:hypothetical protein
VFKTIGTLKTCKYFARGYCARLAKQFLGVGVAISAATPSGQSAGAITALGPSGSLHGDEIIPV